MAEGFLNAFNSGMEVYSAGTHPSTEVHPLAVEVMKEMNIDLSHHHPKSVDRFLGSEFDYVITVCGGAKESCPAFTGKVKHRLHIGFDDPAEAKGTAAEIRAAFTRIRNEILVDFFQFYQNNINR